MDGLAGRGGRALLPDNFHDPVVSLKACAVLRLQISRTWSAVWIKEMLKCVFSGARWARVCSPKHPQQKAFALNSGSDAAHRNAVLLSVYMLVDQLHIFS